MNFISFRLTIPKSTYYLCQVRFIHRSTRFIDSFHVQLYDLPQITDFPTVKPPFLLSYHRDKLREEALNKFQDHRKEYFQTKFGPLKVHPGTLMRVQYKYSKNDPVQEFVGVFLDIKRNSFDSTFTLRGKYFGVYCEMIFPMYSPLVTKVEVIKRHYTRRCKMFTIRWKPKNFFDYDLKNIKPENTEEQIANWSLDLLYPNGKRVREYPDFVHKSTAIINELKARKERGELPETYFIEDLKIDMDALPV
ncbi:hypothetical protein ROZALSC1DRAFT_31916, partial [Rozella allomycis CSF55]